MKKGLFITLEGIDFSGKSTQAKYLLKLLKQHKIDYTFLREPGGTKLSERIRRILLSKGEIDICPRAELWLYQAARSQIVEEMILPALNAGQVVLCDRFYDSTTAYQAYGRGLDKNVILKANLFAAHDLKPDLTLLYDLPEKIAVKRKNKLSRVKDRLENEKAAFFKKVRQGYLELANQNKRRIKVIDASLSIEQVRQISVEIFVKFLQRKNIRIKI